MRGTRYLSTIIMLLVIVIPFATVESVEAQETVTIMQIQGSGDASPLVNQTVTTSGIVIASQQEKGTQGSGFYLQDPDGDGDPATSDGLYIFEAKNHPVSVHSGDLVTVTGKVSEFRGLTELNVTPSTTTIIVTGHIDTLPAPVVLDPPLKNADAVPYFEALEDMLVTVPDNAPVVGPSNQFHEFTVVNPTLGVTRLFQKDEMTTGTGAIVTVGGQSGFLADVKTGDTVSGITGPLSFAFDVYRVDPTQALTVTPGPEIAQPVGANLGANQFTLATFNIENFFDPVPGPGDNKDSTPTPAVYKARLVKVSTAIATMLNAPALVGLEEVENMSVLNDILAQPALAPLGYQAILIPGIDPRGINVALLYRADRVTLRGAPTTFNTCVTLNDNAYPPATDPFGKQDYCTLPDGTQGNYLFPRPPLVVPLVVTVAGGGVPLVVIVNHLKAKTGDDPENKNYTTRRTLEAQALATYVDGLIQGGEPNVAVIGDLNDFPGTPPIDALTKGRTPGSSLRDIVTEANPPYTYVFNGESEILDHILLSDGLSTHFTGVEVAHFDADYPESLAKDGSKVNRVSDHDPPLARFNLAASSGRGSGASATVIPTSRIPRTQPYTPAGIIGPWDVPTDCTTGMADAYCTGG